MFDALIRRWLGASRYADATDRSEDLKGMKNLFNFIQIPTFHAKQTRQKQEVSKVHRDAFRCRAYRSRFVYRLNPVDFPIGERDYISMPPATALANLILSVASVDST